MSEQKERLAKATELKAEASLKNKGFVVIRLTRDNGDTYLGEIEVAGPVARAMAKYITGVADYADALAQASVAEMLTETAKKWMKSEAQMTEERAFNEKRRVMSDEERQFREALNKLRGAMR